MPYGLYFFVLPLFFKIKHTVNGGPYTGAKIIRSKGVKTINICCNRFICCGVKTSVYRFKSPDFIKISTGTSTKIFK